MKVFRLAAYLVLLTLVLNLGDWPFVDEIFAEEAQHQMVSDPDGTYASGQTVNTDKSASITHCTGSIYLSLTNLVDMPSHVFSMAKLPEQTIFSADADTFTSRIPGPLDRPPISLS